MYVCVYVWMCIYVIYMYVCECMYVCINACMYVCMCVRVCVCMCVSVCACVCVRVCMRACVRWLTFIGTINCILASLIQEVGEASLNLVELSIVLCIVDL